MGFWKRPDRMETIREQVDFDALKAVRTERLRGIHSKHWGKKLSLFEKLPLPDDLGQMQPAIDVPLRLDADEIAIGNPGQLNAAQEEAIEEIVASLMPWRKGPFRLFGLKIDAEWRSNLKWDRIAPALGDLGGKRILDVGCGNGYYMFRAAAMNPDLVLGLDPSVPFLMQFELMQRYARRPELQIELLGAEHLGFFREAFEVVLCMGILYHQRNPLGILRDLHRCLVDGGTCLIESQVVPGEDSIAMFPEDRYAKARNVFFVPTTACLVNWLKRTGFEDVEVISMEKTTPQEQRKTRWTTFESLDDFLDPNDHSKTVEGLPAPWRAAIRATRVIRRPNEPR